jgi:autotransporter strand-loop-strand O-heptosyltransferase
MKIVNVTPGLLPIPPKGWGAIEKIIWETHQNLLELGHESKILYTDDVKPGNFDVVHVHVANLANILKERGIPYIFSFHDHHAYLYGKESGVFKENLKAIEGSILSLVPAKYLVQYFDNPKVKYFSHGVNTSYFKQLPNESIIKTDLLCVANNGWAGDPSADRKGFGLAIEAARELDLEITICGPSNNKNFFDKNWYEYSGLTVKYDLSEDELLKEYNSHKIFLSPSVLEAGHPNLTLLEALSCGLPVVATLEPDNNIPGIETIERTEDFNQSLDNLKKGIERVMKDYPNYLVMAKKSSEEYSWRNRIINMIEIYKESINKDMKYKLIGNYENTPIKLRDVRKIINDLSYNFVGGPFVEIKGPLEEDYTINFFDKNTGKLEYTSVIKNNMWTQASKKYYVDWRIEIEGPESRGADKLVVDFNLAYKRVYIALDSKSLGDSLAWVPAVEEFRKKWNCQVVCSTFLNHLFKETYPEITFVNPGESVPDVYAMYTIGWYYFEDGSIDFSKNPSDFKKAAMQKSAFDILGLEYKETVPLLDKSKLKRNIDEKYVCIGPHASALAKYWNYPGGWQMLVDWLNQNGYKVVYISQEPIQDGWHSSKLGGRLRDVIDKSGDLPLEDRMADLYYADYFIGVGSGLSWLAWGMGTQTVMISGFSEPWTEFETNCVRFFNDDPKVCTGCFNTHKLDPGDWRWCPVNKGTPREFECTKTIYPKQIINWMEKRKENI